MSPGVNVLGGVPLCQPLRQWQFSLRRPWLTVAVKVVDLAVVMQRTALMVQTVLCLLEIPQMQFIPVVQRGWH